jgi:hypothetical protein
MGSGLAGEIANITPDNAAANTGNSQAGIFDEKVE